MRSLATRSHPVGSTNGAEAMPIWRLAPDWKDRFQIGLSQPRFAGVVVAPDARTAGLVVELESIQSDAVRDSVRAVLAMLPAFELELGTELYVAGDPVWTVISADSLDRDSGLLTTLMFGAMLALLWMLLRDPWLTVLPLLSIAVVTVAIEGAAELVGIPQTSLLAALPPLLVAIAIAGSIHLLLAVLHESDAAPMSPQAGLDDSGGSPVVESKRREARRERSERVIITAAREVGAGCFWSAMTTAGGFASFLASDLQTFRHFGALAAAGVGTAFLVTFTLLPALLCLRLRRGEFRSHPRRGALIRELLDAIHETVVRHPRFVLIASLGTFVLLALGAGRLQYASDFGFGESSYVVRSLRAIESNFRKPMTTEVVVTLPPGAHVWEQPTLRLLARIEKIFAAEPSTGSTLSFLDLLEEAHRFDRGVPPSSFEALVTSAPRSMPLVATSDQARWVWNELGEDGLERTRVSVDRAWLDDAAQGPYVARVARELAALEQSERGSSGADTSRREGHRIELDGGLVLADRFVGRLRATQLASFGWAFLMVAATLAVLLRRSLTLTVWAIVVNLLPVAALLGLMGWAGIGIDPANTMVAAILLALGVDDTIHVALRVRNERRAGSSISAAVACAFARVGSAVLITSLCLALGFSVLLFSHWGGLVTFGLVACLGVMLLLAGDLLLLPAALLTGERLEQTR
jgi:predicted RND superfamily exporter protein